jgi:phenylpropionate dioxygenase-like ring-hydroxylating dioxygenase large terminal subunit
MLRFLNNIIPHRMSKPSKKQKLYCYVDETGQDTLGSIFIVSVIVAGNARDSMVARLEEIEQESGKGKVKWMKVRRQQRVNYIKAVLSSPIFKHALYFSLYRNSTKYMALTVLSTAKAILSAAPEHSTTTVYVDGLPKSRLRWFGTELRHLSVRNSKVMGVRKEEADSLMCLADAVAGFVRLALSGADREVAELFEQARKRDYLREA